MKKENLAANLRLLCNYKKSISEVCRELQINRQQFNKYLGGKTTPSGNNLLKICDYFGVEEHEMLMPHDEFESIIRVRPYTDTAVGSAPAQENFLQDLQQHQSGDLSKYEGSYYIYYYSTSFQTQILKGYGVVYKENGQHWIKWIERLSKQQKKSSHDGFIYKIKGQMVELGNRIFVTGYEQVLKSELVHLTLFPTFKNKISLLSGLQLGVSGTNSREPVCQRVILAYLGKHCDHRQAMKSCGLYNDDSPEIDPKIKALITNDMAADESIFRGRPI